MQPFNHCSVLDVSQQCFYFHCQVVVVLKNGLATSHFDFWVKMMNSVNIDATTAEGEFMLSDTIAFSIPSCL